MIDFDLNKAILEARKAFEEIEAICLGNRTANTSAVLIHTRKGAVALRPYIHIAESMDPDGTEFK